MRAPERILSRLPETCSWCRSQIVQLYERDSHMHDYIVTTGCSSCSTRLRAELAAQEQASAIAAELDAALCSGGGVVA